MLRKVTGRKLRSESSGCDGSRDWARGRIGAERSHGSRRNCNLDFRTEDKQMARYRKGQRRKRLRADCSEVPARNAGTPAAGSECKPVRGVKLRTVSVITMIFALSCLGAFMAGRPPASAANAGTGRKVAPEAVSRGPLGHDDARSFLRSSRRQRKARTQKIQKSARARPPIRFLLADPKQKNKQPEHV
jgi:hypothetical protein